MGAVVVGAAVVGEAEVGEAEVGAAEMGAAVVGESVVGEVVVGEAIVGEAVVGRAVVGDTGSGDEVGFAHRAAQSASPFVFGRPHPVQPPLHSWQSSQKPVTPLSKLQNAELDTHGVLASHRI